MKTSHILTVLSVAGLLLLAHNNPRDRGPYVAFLSEQATSLMCNGTPGELCADLCTMFQPVASQVTRGVLTLYTEQPSDYVVFTVFRTNLPGQRIYGIGIANTYLLAPIDTESLQLCELLSQPPIQRELDNQQAAMNFQTLGDLVCQ